MVEDEDPDVDGGIADEGGKECAEREDILIDEIAPDGKSENDNGGQPISGYTEKQPHEETFFHGVRVTLDAGDKENDEKNNEGDGETDEVIEN